MKELAKLIVRQIDFDRGDVTLQHCNGNNILNIEMCRIHYLNNLQFS